MGCFFVESSTTTVATIFGWTEQKYLYVPGFAKVKENCSSVSSALDLKASLVLTTVWGSSSLFTQVILAPTGTVMFVGAKAKSLISTLYVFEAVFGVASLDMDLPDTDLSCMGMELLTMLWARAVPPANATLAAAKTKLTNDFEMNFITSPLCKMIFNRTASAVQPTPINEWPMRYIDESSGESVMPSV